ncbi:hypothetical protein ACFUTR_21305 [Streptomyces sp. NPDC057367]|uniref:hypothetical protein n=1 Tax=Streptomyces sp. NPDC057367 TaxID=3346108 RepID=UPI00362FE68A
MNFPKVLTDEHIRAAHEVYQDLSKQHEISIALVSGSLAFGLGHGTSDVDFYVRTVGDTPLEDRVHLRRGYAVQINPITDEKLAKAIEWAGDDSEFTSTNRRMLEVQDDVRKFAIRLTRGHVVHTDDEGRGLLDQLSVDVIRRRVIARQARDTGIHLEDATGALAAGDHDTAYWATRIALTHAIEAALAASDDLYVGRKFLLRRLKRVKALSDVQPQLLGALDVPWADAPAGLEESEEAERFGAAIQERTRLAAYVASAAVLDGWNESMSALAPPRTGTVGPIRDPFHCLMRFGDGIALTGPDKGFRVGEEAARLWFSLDGSRSLDDIGELGSSMRDGVAKLVEIGAAQR